MARGGILPSHLDLFRWNWLLVNHRWLLFEDVRKGEKRLTGGETLNGRGGQKPLLLLASLRQEPPRMIASAGRRRWAGHHHVRMERLLLLLGVKSSHAGQSFKVGRAHVRLLVRWNRPSGHLHLRMRRMRNDGRRLWFGADGHRSAAGRARSRADWMETAFVVDQSGAGPDVWRASGSASIWRRWRWSRTSWRTAGTNNRVDREADFGLGRSRRRHWWRRSVVAGLCVFHPVAVKGHQMVNEERRRVNGNHSARRWRAWTVGARWRGQDRHVTLGDTVVGFNFELEEGNVFAKVRNEELEKVWFQTVRHWHLRKEVKKRTSELRESLWSSDDLSGRAWAFVADCPPPVGA